jgi:intracellular septation protein
MKVVDFFSTERLYKIFIAGLLEFGPVLLFLCSFEYLHVYKATVILMVATIISTVVTFRVQKRLPYLALYVALLTSIFGFITITLHQPKFIQIRDTLYDVTCGMTLLGGLLVRKSFLKLAFHSVLPMSDRAWNMLTHYWMYFFFLAAIINEYVRINFSLFVWFEYKSVMIIVTMVFGLLALVHCYEKE